MSPGSVPPRPEEIETILRNARLRDELEPYADDSLILFQDKIPTDRENEYLAALLAWERAPALPIYRWFDPPLELTPPEEISDSQLPRLLTETIEKLFEQRIVLEFTDHLSDRQLYCMIVRDILPAFEKKIDEAGNDLHWDCARDDEDWLRYYADEEYRQWWSRETGQPAPPHEDPPYPRQLPSRPL